MESGLKGTRLVFDVNETLLDLRVMIPVFEQTFGDRQSLNHWFMLLLQYSWVDTLSGAYHDFDRVGEAVLEMTAHAYQTQLSEARKKELIGWMHHLPPHPEVPEALERLKKADYQMYSFTNSPRHLVQDQMRNSTLGQYFDKWFSIEQIGLFKPHRDTYRTLAYKLGVESQQIRFIASHPWDITGALRAGLKGAFIARGGKPLYALSQPPDIIGADLSEVADLIMAKDL